MRATLPSPSLRRLLGRASWAAARRARPFSGEGKGASSGRSLAGAHQTAIVDELWRARDALKRAAESKHVATGDPTPLPPSAARTSAVYAFSSDERLADSYRNPWGALRLGRVIEDLDALAGSIAFQPCCVAEDGGIRPLLLVTAGVDRITGNDKQKRPTTADDVAIEGEVIWTGSSSLEVQMCVRACSEEEPWLKAFFTYVARDIHTGKATPISQLAPETPEETRNFEGAAERQALKKRLRKQASGADAAAAARISAAAEALLKQSAAILSLPALAPAHHILMRDTALSNTFMTQPQQRNTAGRIFGGFLMRRAFELAFTTAYLFGGRLPRFEEVDDVSFKLPVEVGRLVQFESAVLYVSGAGQRDPLDFDSHELLCVEPPVRDGRPRVHIEVRAKKVEPERAASEESNTFHFTFSYDVGEPLKKPMPSDIDEATRAVKRRQLDAIQS